MTLFNRSLKAAEKIRNDTAEGAIRQAASHVLNQTAAASPARKGAPTDLAHAIETRRMPRGR